MRALFSKLQSNSKSFAIFLIAVGHLISRRKLQLALRGELVSLLDDATVSCSRGRSERVSSPLYVIRPRAPRNGRSTSECNLDRNNAFTFWFVRLTLVLHWNLSIHVIFHQVPRDCYHLLANYQKKKTKTVYSGKTQRKGHEGSFQNIFLRTVKYIWEK